MIDQLEKLISLLSTSGGWGVAGVILYLYVKKDKQLQEVSEDRHDEVVAILGENVAAMTAVKETIGKCEGK